MRVVPFLNMSEHDEYMEFYDDAGTLVRAQRRHNFYDIYVRRDGDELVHDGKAFVKSDDCERVYNAYLDQKNLDNYFEVQH